MKFPKMIFTMVSLLVLFSLILVVSIHMINTKPSTKDFTVWFNDEYGISCEKKDCIQKTDEHTIPLSLIKRDINDNNPLYLSIEKVYKSGEAGYVTVKSIGLMGKFFTTKYLNNY
ncbi:hypothetical protein [Bacillus sp. X1(2014)]|uniref:hypothetical protein n=1 Tax=Bacillus sp. X1(2014) TaxID=1565991 RepID=UPI0011A9B507|nr:hypothetical protein [Bacillus sp. X1(2014)]